MFFFSLIFHSEKSWRDEQIDRWLIGRQTGRQRCALHSVDSLCGNSYHFSFDKFSILNMNFFYLFPLLSFSFWNCYFCILSSNYIFYFLSSFISSLLSWRNRQPVLQHFYVNGLISTIMFSFSTAFPPFQHSHAPHN